jgi:hypothetical protein
LRRVVHDRLDCRKEFFTFAWHKPGVSPPSIRAALHDQAVRRAALTGFAATATIPVSILLGSVLLFLVEPMIAKMILPWFGGTAGVWTTCLLFFQVTLCIGYVYAHGSARLLTPAGQRLLHVGLLAASLLLLPVIPSPVWKPTGEEAPALRVLMLLAVTIGLPFVLLSATGPLMQAWLSRRHEAGGLAANPYRLFALSNFGSLLALLAYPIVVEPLFDTVLQARLWSAAYVVFAFACAGTAWVTSLPVSIARAPDAARAEGRVSLVERILWFVLSAAPSMLLLAVTGHITQNVAAIPLLWVGPLAIYLLTLILCFESSRWYKRVLFCIAFAEFLPAMMYAAVGNHANSDPRLLVGLYSAGLFTACMLCHGELAGLRPRTSHLTSFYLTVAAGGAAGALLAAAVAPAVLDALYDLPIALALTGIVAIFVVHRARPPRDRAQLLTYLGAILLWILMVGWGAQWEYMDSSSALVRARNFYGALKVVEVAAADGRGAVRRLMYGTIIHGEEFQDPLRRCIPTTYYSPQSGVGLALASLEAAGAVRIGVIGLGVGTLAAYARPRDSIRFYEINPLVPVIASRDFDYLDSCGAAWSLRLGDGRLGLEAEPDRQYDLLVIDAFSGDAIPAHLLTLEAFRLYQRHLARGGVIAVHVSNQFLDLAPVVARAADAIETPARLVTNTADAESGRNMAQWVLISSRPGLFSASPLADGTPIDPPDTIRAWTDDYSNLWRSLK